MEIRNCRESRVDSLDSLDSWLLVGLLDADQMETLSNVSRQSDFRWIDLT